MPKHTGLILVSITIIVLLIATVLGISMLGLIPNGGTTTTQTGTSQTGCSSGGCARKLPIRFTFINIYTSQPITDSITANIYKGTVSVDSVTTFNGLWDTTKADFQSGDEYAVYVTSGASKYEFNFQVPLAQNLTQARFQLTLNMALIGSYTITVLGPDGVTPITSSYNATSGICNGVTACKASKQPVFTVILTNNIDNTGLTGSFSRNEISENGGVRQLTANALVVTMSSSSGAPAKIHMTTPIITLPDHAVDKHRLQDGSLDQNARGTYTTTLTLDTSSMVLGSTEIITITYYAYISLDYYSDNQTVNSEAVALASFQFVVSV